MTVQHTCECWQCRNTTDPMVGARGGIDREAQPSHIGLPDLSDSTQLELEGAWPLPLNPLDCERTVHDTRCGNVTMHRDKGYTARDFSGENLSKVDLENTRFSRCDLSNVCFDGSDLSRASFLGCNLNDATFIGALLPGARFVNCVSNHKTIWSKHGHYWRDSRLTELQLVGLRANYSEEWKAPWICSDCGEDENDGCTCNQCEECGSNECECCWRCERSPDNCRCCGECESLREDCSCHDDNEERSSDLYSYSTDIFDKLAWPPENARNALVFGVELECEARDEDRHGQKSIIEALGGSIGENYILKCDASLTYGVEIVSLPYTLDQHRQTFGWDRILKPLADIAKSGARTTNCGMHCHINRAALSPLTLGKMLVFANCAGMHDMIDLIAQRSQNSYCVRRDKKITDGQSNSARRESLNVRDATVEVRIFRGNTRPERVIKNISFCHAMVQYARASSMLTIESVDHFTHWLIGHRGAYPELVSFLIEKQAPGFAGLAKLSAIDEA
jgi:Pentapeptide repeats (9 copies)